MSETNPVPSQSTVVEIGVGAVERGDVIWSQDDRDWFLVDRIDNDGFEAVFYRDDHSLATFGSGDRVLKRLG